VGSDLENAVEGEVRPVIEGLGFSLVELAVRRSHRLTHLRLVIHRDPAVTLEDCTRVARTLRPRLELMEELPDLAMEVSSPGVDRKLKRPEEYVVFRNKGVKLLLQGRSEWVGGVIRGLEGQMLSIEQETGTQVVSLADIRAARLDQTQEVGR
jgi:ribosome maturation factor RimP